jgi:ubiquitin-like protein Pup
MPRQKQLHKNVKGEATSVAVPVAGAVAPSETKPLTAALLDEIDDLLDEECQGEEEAFIQSFVQQGGQ